MFLEKRDVLEEELLLQVFGASGDDDAFAGEDGGDEIGERFAGAGAGLDHEVLAIGESGFDGLGHLELAGPKLIIRMPLGKRPVAGEELTHAGGLGGSGHEGLFDCSGVGGAVRWEQTIVACSARQFTKAV